MMQLNDKILDEHYAHLANKVAKDYFKRPRPFVYFHEPSISPERDEEQSKGYSYPSGHASRGWVYAMTLALVNPDSTYALLNRAQEYAIGRVICGHHYKSDIDTSLMLAATIMGALAQYISDESVKDFQPMGANFGVLPPIEPHIRDKKARYEALAVRSLKDQKQYLEQEGWHV